MRGLSAPAPTPPTERPTLQAAFAQTNQALSISFALYFCSRSGRLDVAPTHRLVEVVHRNERTADSAYRDEDDHQNYREISIGHRSLLAVRRKVSAARRR